MNNSMDMPPNMNIKTQEPLPHIPVVTSVSCCFVLSILYVASLYVWNNKNNRDHPATIKRRFCSVSVVMILAPLFIYNFSSPELLQRVPFSTLLGLRWEGLWQGIIIPYFLTVLLFLGPLCVQFQNDTLRIYLDKDYWRNSIVNIMWLRNHIVAPLSEEFVFRACMMPLILQSFPPVASVFITPLFFGVAHVHHIVERLSLGIDLGAALLITCFQFIYTTLFGFYSSFLFARTGHLLSPFIVHAFCNHMGLPDLQDLWQQSVLRRTIAIVCYIVGFVGWVFLLPIATIPSLYDNRLYWNV